MDQTRNDPPRDDASRPAQPGAPAPRTAPVEVDVTRSGGIAGMTRRWRAEPADDEVSQWVALIDRCPWNDVSARASGDGRGPVADGFVWRISARWTEDDRREAELPDDAVTGAWRDLVDAVRAWSSPDGRSTGVASRD
jgi:hypothetical protein